MAGPIEYMTKNHVAANMLMIILVVGGLLIGRTIKQEVFPEFELDMVMVNVVYPGATPSEVEDAIVRPIELAVSGVDNIKRIRATATENVGTVTIEVLEGEDADEVLQDVKSEVDRILTFPEEAEKPMISKLTNRQQVLSMVVYGDASERALREQAEHVRDDLLANEKITQVEISASRPYEISIEIPEESLRKYNLTLDRVAQIIRGASLDLAGGTIKADGGDVLIRTQEKRYTGTEFDSVAVFKHPDGRMVLLSEIGEVKDAFQEADREVLFDGKPSVTVMVYRVGEQTPKEIAAEVKKYIDQRNVELPSTIQLAIYEDMSEILQSRMELLLRNGFLGLALVLIILTVFLEMRLAFFVALGILIAFIGSLIFLPALNISINMISLFGFLIIIGVVVDDAIVIGENIFVHFRRGKPLIKAAIDGAREMSRPVVFAGLTTFAAFGPLIFVGGFVGKFMGLVPTIVITVLVISLIESLFILPSHLASRVVESKAPIWQKIENRRSGVDKYVRRLIDGFYLNTLKWVTRNRYLTFAIAIAFQLATIGLFTGGLVKVTFMPEIEADWVTVTLEMPPGTPYEETRRHALRIQQIGEELIKEEDSKREDGGSNLEHVFALVGQSIGADHFGGSNTFSSNIAQMYLMLADPEERTIKVSEFANEWRERVGEIPGVESLSFRSDLIMANADLEIQLSHNDYDALLAAVERLKGALGEYAGLREIADSHTKGKRELKLKLRPEAASLGINERDLAVQVRSAFYGAEAMRIQRGQNEVKVMVRYPEEDRRSMASIEQMMLRTPSGDEIPFYQAAYVEEGRGYSTITRTDRRRVVNVTASVNKKVANTTEILDDLKAGTLNQLLADYPGLAYDLEGRSRDQQESAQDVIKAFMFGLLLIYALLAVLFKSFVQPLIVMSAIPFGIIGAVIGHMLLGYSMSMISMWGIVALNGVVVNSSLVMIDLINRSREAGMPVYKAVLESGKRRFRPIVMTALTTFFGLSPMIMETSLQARFLVPMALSLGFGVLFSTAITLVLVPALYMILDDARTYFVKHIREEELAKQEKVGEVAGEVETV